MMMMMMMMMMEEEAYGFMKVMELGEPLDHRFRFRGREAEELHVVHLGSIYI
jgi:hypothetical protein